MNTKTKITEIKETYTSRQRVRNAQGEFEFVQKTMTRFKPVNPIEGWARFGAFLLDLVFILIFEAILGVVLGIVIVIFGDASSMETEAFDIGMRLLTWLVIRPLYYIFFEGVFQATPAKLILGRVVVDEYGEKPSFGQILGRSYARIVPFEAFSCLSTYGWHDSWSNTMVLRKEDLKGLKLALQVQDFNKTPQESPSQTNLNTL